MQQLLEPYPGNCLLPKLADAVIRLERYSQVPQPMAASSAMSAISLACQGGYMVERKPGLIYPIGLAMLTIATRSERKSSIDRRFLRPIREYEKQLASAHKEHLQDWRDTADIYTAKKTGLRRLASALILTGKWRTSRGLQEMERLCGPIWKTRVSRPCLI